MIDELERIWEKAVVAYSKCYAGICLERGKLRKMPVRRGGILAEIRTKDNFPSSVTKLKFWTSRIIACVYDSKLLNASLCGEM
jgi:hypothetical protein